MIRVLIVDDEPLARARLQRLLAGSPYQVCGEAGDGEEALKLSREHHPDVMLLDIRMPGTDGLEVASRLADFEHPPAIVFTTAYDEYALEAFKVRAQNYLLKPVRKEDLFDALSKVTQLTQAQQTVIQQHQQGAQSAHLVCRSVRGVQRIPLTDVLYLQAADKYVTVVHKSGETLSDQTLKELEQTLKPHMLRIHRNTLINHHYLDRLQRVQDGHFEVYLKGVDQGLSVSRRLVSEVKSFLNEQ
ncbi:LytR/AlgR family response regulator transcription factor [Hahella ganghwensis]|uniref:LytR/AlgR family response regulator transcription factor n=1 Tax=Hahella ganghwensis TaxID=286420 RepID=UPI00036AD9E0|nr:LytTR family DNA-binding domain-containing protein [Hahella ganghwensis]